MDDFNCPPFQQAWSLLQQGDSFNLSLGCPVLNGLFVDPYACVGNMGYLDLTQGSQQYSPTGVYVCPPQQPGIPLGVTELFGEAGAGKTQLALQLMLTAMLPRESGGLDGSVVVVNTERAFPWRRWDQLQHQIQKHTPTHTPTQTQTHTTSQRHGNHRDGASPSPTPTLPSHATTTTTTTTTNKGRVCVDDLDVFRVHDLSELTTALTQNITDLIVNKHSSSSGRSGGRPVRLLVIDSLAALFANDDSTTTTTTTTPAMSAATASMNRSLSLFELAEYLKMLSSTYHVHVLVINHVSDVFDSNSNSGSGEWLGNSGVYTVVKTSVHEENNNNNNTNNAGHGEVSTFTKTSFEHTAPGNGYRYPYHFISSGRKVKPGLTLTWSQCITTRLCVCRNREGEQSSSGDLTTTTTTTTTPTMSLLSSPHIRRLHLVFSSSSQSASIPFLIDATGVHGVSTRYSEDSL